MNLAAQRLVEFEVEGKFATGSVTKRSFSRGDQETAIESSSSSQGTVRLRLRCERVKR